LEEIKSVADINYIPNAKSVLGEGPIYNEMENALYWTDIKSNRLYKYDLESKDTDTYTFSKLISSFVFTKENKIIATTKDGFEYLDTKTLSTKKIVNPEENIQENRFNDGKCDKKGRYFAGTMDNNEDEVTGSLYCFDGKNIEKKEKDLFISNGLGWNNDSSKFYLTDSPTRTIYVYDYSLETSKMSNKKVFVKLDEKDGYPDGLCVDSEDYIWGAHWDGWKITRYTPDGKIDKVYDLPVPNVSSCCFGGPNLDILFITSAQKGLSPQELQEAPLSGNTFYMQTNTKGQKTNFFNDKEE